MLRRVRILVSIRVRVRVMVRVRLVGLGLGLGPLIGDYESISGNSLDKLRYPII